MKEEVILREGTFSPRVKTYIFFCSSCFFIFNRYWNYFNSYLDFWVRAMDEREVLQNLGLSNHEQEFEIF